MEDLALHTGAVPVTWEDNTSCISVVEAIIFTPIVKNIYIAVCFLQKNCNGIFVTKYDKSSIMLVYMCTKTCSGSIISRSIKCMTGFRFYLTSDTEHYKLMRLHEFVMNYTNYIELPRIMYYVIAHIPE